jgi:3-dehydroquinate synthase
VAVLAGDGQVTTAKPEPRHGTEVARIQVQGGSPYEVVVGRGVLADVAHQLPESVQRVALICSADQERIADSIRGSLSDAGFRPQLVEVPAGEQAKTVDVAAACWQRLARDGFTRSDAVISVGGGATSDLAGFVAATFLRGVAVVHVPTTLLGMVDAAVGGKTGVNIAEGKNLVGAFHEPLAVVCDLDTLATLPHGEVASGLAEVVKCGFVADTEILRLVEADPAAATDPSSPTLRELLERAVAVKAAVVSADLREATSTGSDVGREVLNYGHTMGHAIERVEGYTVRHGAAVSIGMVYVAELAALCGRLRPNRVQRHRDVLTRVGLPTTYRAGRWPQLLDAMRVDKKSRGDRLRFVALEDVGRPVILDAPDPDLLQAAYQRICAPPPG